MLRVNLNSVFCFLFLVLAFFARGEFAFCSDLPVVTNFVYDDHGKRDPFWSLLGSRGTILNFDNDIQASDMVLEGILVEPNGDSVAIINGNIVKVGDKVGFFIVKEIQVNVVVLGKGQEIVTLKLKKEE